MQQPADVHAHVGQGITTSDETLQLDERKDVTAWDRTCNPQPYLAIDGGKLVLKRHNGAICKTYSIIQ